MAWNNMLDSLSSGLGGVGGTVTAPQQPPIFQNNPATQQPGMPPQTGMPPNSGVLGPVMGNPAPGGPMPPQTAAPQVPGTPPQIGMPPQTGAPSIPGMPPQLGTTTPPTNPFSPWAPVGGATTNPTMSGMPMPPGPGFGQYGDGTYFGGQSTTGAQAQPADYESVRGFSDAAYDQSMRYLQPQMDQQNRRFDQELINQGIDPNSAAGQDALAQMQRGQNDLLSKASFDALGFGQGLQDQMFQQDFGRSQLASGMAQGQWNNTSQLNNALNQLYGNQLGFLGDQMGMQTSQYLGELGHSLGKGNLDLGRQQQSWNEMMGMEGLNQWEANFNRDNARWQDELGLSMLGMNSPYLRGTQAPIGAGDPYGYLSEGYKGLRGI